MKAMIVVLFLIALLGCTSKGGAKRTASSGSTEMTLMGAGSTFVYPLMLRWAGEYQYANGGVRVNYRSIGSGGGIRQVSQGVVDFGASDSPMTDQQIAASKVGKLLHVPVVMGADVPAYNIPGFTSALNFTPEALAGIFLGKVTNWNDERIVKVNSGIHIPKLPIVVVYRSDESGTTYIWTDYLSKINPEWSRRVGKSTTVNWPVGLGAERNEGVARLIRNTPGAIGYLELIYAEANMIPFGAVQNSSGTFVKASMDSVTAAAAMARIPDDFRYSITNSPAKDAYPISGTTWLLMPMNAPDKDRGKQVVAFANWVLGPGQDLAASLHYARLPNKLIGQVKQSLNQVQ